jgi:hypothetical protein
MFFFFIAWFLSSVWRQINVLRECLLRLLHEAVQENQQSRSTQNSTRAMRLMGQAASNFPYIPAKGTDERHSDRPCELDILDVLSNDPPISWIQTLQPFPHRFTAAVGTIEARRKALQLYLLRVTACWKRISVPCFGPAKMVRTGTFQAAVWSSSRIMR